MSLHTLQAVIIANNFKRSNSRQIFYEVNKNETRVLDRLKIIFTTKN